MATMTMSGSAAIRGSGESIEADLRTHWLRIDELLPADSPRLDGEDAEHTRMLAESDAELTPIIVHRSTMRIIDGMHRFGAAMMRKADLIEVRYFDGSVEEAFVLAVKANVTHGRPLSFRDRVAAAERIIREHPTWSDRAIAASAGLGARTVGGVRRRVEAVTESARDVPARVGLDGRVRPLDNTEGRLKAAEIMKSRPDASLREIAKRAGVSPMTARDVRKRVQRGDDPVPVKHSSRPNPDVDAPVANPRVTEEVLSSRLKSLVHDPSLRFSESGRTLVRWLLARAIRFEEWQEISCAVPPHARYIIADMARRFAEEWSSIAEEMERKTRETAT